jgi:hypothetical protein
MLRPNCTGRRCSHLHLSCTPATRYACGCTGLEAGPHRDGVAVAVAVQAKPQAQTPDTEGQACRAAKRYVQKRVARRLRCGGWAQS